MALLRLPVFVLMLAVLAGAMLVPAAHAAIAGDERTARGFLYGALFSAVAAGLLGLSLGAVRSGRAPSVERELGALLLGWALLPGFAAVPVHLLMPQIGLAGALFEMVAAFTTTGGTVFGAPEAVGEALHLWRALVGWLGGLLTLTAAWAVLAPRRLGGFEIDAATWRMQDMDAPRDRALGIVAAPLSQRLRRAVRVILPLYAGLTGALALIFSATGQSALDSAIHAMAILSTSGISAHAGGLAAVATPAAEGAAALFLLTAATRALYTDASAYGGRIAPHRDPELRMLAGLVALVTLGLFLRHWVGALTIALGPATLGMGEALWGTFFTVLSFLTTTGFESASWRAARDWSGLANPGLILLGLAAIGGGAATTAGGIKLIRAYALLRHGRRELERLAQPNSVIGIGAATRSLLREGPVIVWTFMMLFIFAILAAVLTLTALGLRFDTATLAAIAAIANCGPAFEMVVETGRSFADFTGAQRGVLMALMIVGRVETLALIALFNPDVWRWRADRTRGGRERAGKSTPSSPR